jgi:glycerol-3-phosphate acyltransferase PlsY
VEPGLAVGVTLGLFVAHLVGTFPSARIVGRRAGFDPTAAGSHNPGATNALRLGGRRAGAAVLLLDLVKGALAAAAGLVLDGAGLGLALGAAAVTGHVLPVTRGFRGGGKGVATAAGAALVVEPTLAGGAALVFAVVAALGRRASLASLAGVVALPVLALLAGRPVEQVVGWAAVAALVVARHTGNLRRLVAGTEPTIGTGGA